MTHRIPSWLCLFLLLLCACGDPEPTDARDSGVVPSDGGSAVDGAPGGPSATCQSARITNYAAGLSGACEFPSNLPILPQFVRDKLTIAIAEGWYDSSHGGDAAEACGECWEVDTLTTTQVMMVDNLCPANPNNPLCSSDVQLHFDLSQEAGAVVGSALGEVYARPVPCPVTGQVHVLIKDRQPSGYLRAVFVNHRLPIRLVEYRASDGTWQAADRSGGAWSMSDAALADSGAGAAFRITSALGETVEGTEVLSYGVGVDQIFDIGAQFAEVEPEGAACEYLPPRAVYDEDWGGIEAVDWRWLTWGDATLDEVSTGCADDSASCLALDLTPWHGARFYLINPFFGDTFSRLRLAVRTESGSGAVAINVDAGPDACETIEVTVDESWQTVEIPLPGGCAGATEVNGVSIAARADALQLVVDEVFFSP